MNLEQFENEIRINVIKNHCPPDQMERPYKERLWIQLHWRDKQGRLTDVLECTPETMLLKRGGIQKSFYCNIKLEQDLEIWIRRPQDKMFWRLEK